MSSEQQYWWKIALELKLRKCSGNAFQDFFSDVMLHLHSDDFVRIRPHGKLGDKGCDGYLQSSGQVFQCYGGLNGETKTVALFIKKMSTDFGKAATKLSAILKEWHMVHNLVDGLPIEAVEELESLRKKNTNTKFGFIGLDGFADRIFQLTQEKIEALLGPAASTHDVNNLEITELRKLIAAVAKKGDEAIEEDLDLREVSPKKLIFNKLPNHWRHLISGGWQNAHLVEKYLSEHHDPVLGEKIAKVFRDHYQYLKAQNLGPNAIMSGLYELVNGIGYTTAAQQVASQALLALLFENCDIFEPVPKEVA